MWPPACRDAAQRVSNLSRAYRVNLTVLALVALFTGAFLVFSVLSLSVARRARQFALLGVLGLTARQRLRLVRWSRPCWALGSVLGVALGTALAALALRLLGGDLGGGYFPGAVPALQWGLPAPPWSTAALGLLAALAGGWWPARAVHSNCRWRRRSGSGACHGVAAATGVACWWWQVACWLLLPPVANLPRWRSAMARWRCCWWGGHHRPALGRDAAVRPAGALGGAARCCRCWRWSARAGYAARPWPSMRVVASLSLAVALTVMVASFPRQRDAVAGCRAARRACTCVTPPPGAMALAGAHLRAAGGVPLAGRPAWGTLRTQPLLLDPARRRWR